MATPIGHQRSAIGQLFSRDQAGDDKVVWPAIDDSTEFSDGTSPLYFLGVSVPRSHRTSEESPARVAVFGTAPAARPPAVLDVRDCVYAVLVRPARDEEAERAGVDRKTAETVESLRYESASGSVIRFLPTGTTATYAVVH